MTPHPKSNTPLFYMPSSVSKTIKWEQKLYSRLPQDITKTQTHALFCSLQGPFLPLPSQLQPHLHAYCTSGCGLPPVPQIHRVLLCLRAFALAVLSLEGCSLCFHLPVPPGPHCTSSRLFLGGLLECLYLRQVPIPVPQLLLALHCNPACSFPSPVGHSRLAPPLEGHLGECRAQTIHSCISGPQNPIQGGPPETHAE